MRNTLRIRLLPHGFRFSGFGAEYAAVALIEVGRGRVWLCRTWFPGFQITGASVMFFIVPGLAFGWTRRSW